MNKLKLFGVVLLDEIQEQNRLDIKWTMVGRFCAITPLIHLPRLSVLDREAQLWRGFCSYISSKRSDRVKQKSLGTSPKPLCRPGKAQSLESKVVLFGHGCKAEVNHPA